MVVKKRAIAACVAGAVLVVGVVMSLAVKTFAQGNTAPPTGVQVWNSKPVADEADLPGEHPEALKPITIVGTRNGSFSGKIVLTSKQAMKNVRAEVSVLRRTNGRGRIPAAAVKVRYGLHLPTIMCFDPLAGKPPAESPVVGFGRRIWKSKSRAAGNALQPIWVIVDVPADAVAGDYEGKLTVAVGSARPFAVPVKLKVCDWRLPDPREFQTFVELIQSPETVAMAYEVPLWSEKHFQLMEKSLELMGKIGCKTAYVHLMCETNQGNSETMVRWIRQKDGSFKHDFTIMDKYLDLVEKHQGTPAIVCLYAWDRVFVDTRDDPRSREGPTLEARKELAGKGPPVTVLDPATGKTEKVFLAPYTTPESRQQWRPLFEGIRARMKKRGWEKSMVLGLASDMPPDPKTIAFFEEICPGVPWMRHGHGSWRNMRTHGRGKADSNKFFYQASVLGRQFAYQRRSERVNPGNERWYGWLPTPQGRHKEGGSIVVHFPRQFVDSSARCKFRMLGEVNIAGNQRGFGRIGADFWPVLKDRRGRTRGRIADRYPQNILGHLTIQLALLHPGPEGAIPTARYQVMLEGLAECEARIFIEKAILEKRISGDLAKRCQDMLDERVNALTEQMGDKWGYGDFHWMNARLEYPKFINSDWQARSEKLFSAAAEVDRTLAGR